METDRFEDKIKQQLLDRKIAPSVESWDKLSAKLDAIQEKKRPFGFWMGIAASIIGGILILSLVFNNSNPTYSPEIVNVPNEELEIEKAPVEISKENFTETQKEESQVATSDSNNQIEAPRKNSTGAPLEKQIQQENREALVVLDNKGLLQEQTTISESVITSDKTLDLKLIDAVAGVIEQTENGQSVTDDEVNKLLAAAASKISQERYKPNFAAGRVNPQDLLQDVEFEMDNSFRDKIFEMLRDGYSKARTAIANRNY